MSGGDPRAAALGRNGERWAAAYLRQRGWAVIGQGFHSAGGEIDLVCRRGDSLLMAEVKTRTSDRWGRPEAAVNTAKQDRLRRAARDYRQLNAWHGPIAHGIVAITLNGAAPPHIDFFEQAF